MSCDVGEVTESLENEQVLVKLIMSSPEKMESSAKRKTRSSQHLHAEKIFKATKLKRVRLEIGQRK